MDSTFLVEANRILMAQARVAKAELESGKQEGEEPDHWALMSFGAHAFALAEKVADHLGSAQLGHLPQPSPFSSVEEMLEAFIASRPPSELDFYVQAERALKTIEKWLADLEPVHLETLRPETILTASVPCELYGRVVHWFGARRALRELRNSRREMPGPSQQEAPRRPIEVLDTLFFHWISPKRTAKIVRARPTGKRTGLLSLEAQKGGLRIALCPMPERLYPIFRITKDGGYFHAEHADSFHDCSLAIEHCSAVLEAADRHRVDLLLLPELMVCKKANEHIAAYQKERGRTFPLGVVAGSFHVDHDSLPVNRSQLLGTGGESLAAHGKRGQFRVKKKDVETLPGPFPNPPSNLKEDIFERIRRSDPIQLLETRIGRVALAICADCIAPDSLETLYQELRPDLLLVVAMSPETEPFLEAAYRMAAWGIATLFVNASTFCPPGEVLAMANLAIKEPRLPTEQPLPPPTFVRWRKGAQRLESWRYRRPKGGDPQSSRWRELEELDLRGSGLDWLEAPTGERFGLIVDYRPHFDWTRRLVPLRTPSLDIQAGQKRK